MSPARKFNLDDCNPPSSAVDQPMASADSSPGNAEQSTETDTLFNDAYHAVSHLGEGSSPHKYVSPSTPPACDQVPEEEDHVSPMNEESPIPILDDTLGKTTHRTDGR